MFNLNGKIALITGASQGIGEAICLKYASLGANIIVNYIGAKENAEKVAKKCHSFGVKAIMIKADVSNNQEVKELIQKSLEEFGRIDILVNNAGITKDNLMMRMSEEEFDQVVNVNLKGSFLCMKHTTRIFMKQRSGRIINMASVVGIRGNIGQVNYSASKAGIIGMTKSMARELASRNVTVNAIAPGFVETNMTDVLDEQVKKQIKTQIPLARLATVEDIANVAVFLASDEANYITGQVIAVDGGMAI